jgi:hypothetical protein
VLSLKLSLVSRNNISVLTEHIYQLDKENYLVHFVTYYDIEVHIFCLYNNMRGKVRIKAMLGIEHEQNMSISHVDTIESDGYCRCTYNTINMTFKVYIYIYIYMFQTQFVSETSIRVNSWK